MHCYFVDKFTDDRDDGDNYSVTVNVLRLIVYFGRHLFKFSVFLWLVDGRIHNSYPCC
jgi:hypothetical protein